MLAGEFDAAADVVVVEVSLGDSNDVQAVLGDEVLDTSVKARLEQMKIALTA